MRPNVESVPLKSITLDARLQNREFGISQEKVDEYAEVIDELPPGLVFDDGKNKWLAGGWHRYYAHQKAKKESILCEVRKGTFLEAFEAALGENASHGVPRTQGDKRKAVLSALEENDKGNYGWNNCKIAKLCRVSEFLVRAIKKEKREQAEKRTEEGEFSINRKFPLEGRLFAGDADDGEAAENNGDSGHFADSVVPDPIESAEPQDDAANGEEDGKEEVPCDEEGVELPPQAIAAFDMKHDLHVFLKTLDQAARKCEEIGKSPLGIHMHWQSAQASIRAARKTLHQGRPAHVCPYCQGDKKDCRACRGHGFVTAAAYEQRPEALEKKGRK